MSTFTDTPKSISHSEPLMDSDSQTAKKVNGTASVLFNKHAFHNGKGTPYDNIDWETRSVHITGESGDIHFSQDNVEVPAGFSDLAAKILASKYFYGDPRNPNPPEEGGRENSFKQVVRRVTATLAQWGLEDGYFADGKEAKIFEEDLAWLCLHQYGAFNSPVWFNLGLGSQYQVRSRASGVHHRWDEEQGKAIPVEDAYEHPQCSACFIQKVEDNLESIMELARSEAFLFKYGSGSGTDLSPIRSSRESLAGGGRASGPLSFLAVYDSVAGVIRSGGKTRRAAKMNTLRVSHPDIEEFIEAKKHEELKARSLMEGGYSGGINGEAYASVRFQNENLSVRVSDRFMEAAELKDSWWTRNVNGGEPCEKKQADRLLRMMAECTHYCGDPGIQFEDTIQRWHTCKGSGPQNCSNPCGEFLFLDNTACNLASLNLMKFQTEKGFDTKRFAEAVRIFIVAQDILVDRSSYPTEGIAYNSHWFRPLGLGYANLGALLMTEGLPYDSDAGRELASLITAIMTGYAYSTSVELARRKGVFKGLDDPRHFGMDSPPGKDNRDSMLGVIQLHRDTCRQTPGKQYPALHEEANAVWDEVVSLGEKEGFRNAQVTVLAPTGTIGFLMDCDTTGIEPAIGLMAYKSLAGGGVLAMPLRCVEQALVKLGYTEEQRKVLLTYLTEHGTFESVQGSNESSGLKAEHLPIFDGAFVSGGGIRSLTPSAHLKMMAATQPFLSGGISKTVNMPREATVEMIEATYLEAWKIGLKGVALYRDGSKLAAPLRTRKEEKDKTPVQVITEPYRRRLEDTRSAVTHKFQIGGAEGYFTVGQFEDGQPGELFVQMSKAGSTINGLMDTIGILVSLCLQFGVPLEALVKKFTHFRFEPEGFTSNPEIPVAKSVVDYLFRWLAIHYIEGYRERMTPTRTSENDSQPTETAVKQDTEQLQFLVSTEAERTCPECGSHRVKVTGNCACCTNCGASLGCS